MGTPSRRAARPPGGSIWKLEKSSLVENSMRLYFQNNGTSRRPAGVPDKRTSVTSGLSLSPSSPSPSPSPLTKGKRSGTLWEGNGLHPKSETDKIGDAFQRMAERWFLERVKKCQATD